jgi:hypothetical protein
MVTRVSELGFHGFRIFATPRPPGPPNSKRCHNTGTSTSTNAIVLVLVLVLVPPQSTSTSN